MYGSSGRTSVQSAATNFSVDYAGNTCGVFDQMRFFSASIPAAKPGEEDNHFVRLRYWRHGSIDKFILIE